MNYVHIEGTTVPDAYHQALLILKEQGAIVPVPDYNSRMREIPAIINIDRPTLEPRISRMVICGPADLMQYELEIVEGVLDKRVGHGWDYTYHQRIAEQIPELISEFKRNIHSRRAVLQVRDWHHDFFTSDPACLQLINYDIRENKLNCTAYMRSNDLYNATFMNIWGFVRLQEYLAGELNKSGLEISIGRYTHIANSLHVYEKDWEKFDHNLAEYTRRISEKSSVTYEYASNWDALMQAEVPQIMDKVRTLTEGM
jgi:thymidylate synthase